MQVMAVATTFPLPIAWTFPPHARVHARPGAPGHDGGGVPTVMGTDTYACNLTARHPGKMTQNVGKMTQMLGNNWARYVCCQP